MTSLAKPSRHCDCVRLQPRRTNPKKPANLRSWRVIIIRSRGEYLASVEAPDRERAEVIAIRKHARDLSRRMRVEMGGPHAIKSQTAWEPPGAQRPPRVGRLHRKLLSSVC
jgi:hypothetical protein